MTPDEPDNTARLVLTGWLFCYLVALTICLNLQVRVHGVRRFAFRRDFWILMLCLPVSWLAVVLTCPAIRIWEWTRRAARRREVAAIVAADRDTSRRP